MCDGMWGREKERRGDEREEGRERERERERWSCCPHKCSESSAVLLPDMRWELTHERSHHASTATPVKKKKEERRRRTEGKEGGREMLKQMDSSCSIWILERGVGELH